MSAVTPKDTAGYLDKDFAEDGLINIPSSARASTRCITVTNKLQIVHGVFDQGWCVLRRAMPNGDADPEFGMPEGDVRWRFNLSENTRPKKILAKADGKLLLLGLTGNEPFKQHIAFTRFNDNGTPDLIHGTVIIPYPDVPVPPDHQLSIQEPDACLTSDNQLLVTSGFVISASDGSDIRVGLIYRFDKDGKPDPTFGKSGCVEVRFKGEKSEIHSVSELADQRIIVFGTLDRPSDGLTNQRAVLACYSPQGVLDETFGDRGFREWSYVGSLGKMSIAGDRIFFATLATANDASLLAVHRVLPNGVDDPSFNEGQVLFVDLAVAAVFPAAIVVQPDGKIVIGYHTFVSPSRPQPLGWLRINQAGELDPTFGEAGKVWYDGGYMSDGLFQANSNRILFAAEIEPNLQESYAKVIGVLG
ncbi:MULTISPECIES: hypothetical protein [Pseudomonas]|uniref:Delta-60 repeat protein n=1 Tax=Pseudomonas aphyarum TaxID=2942629 RepID=A0ABT5PJJ4_9PSED|nr:hypothetical protein [Pseudomonas aphyarum]MDD0968354.1 hypothetical protein [Pseudomonas aphyarum]MDD1124053.1 hypothetical protein [Pseudomonas aphyarum]